MTRAAGARFRPFWALFPLLALFALSLVRLVHVQGFGGEADRPDPTRWVVRTERLEPPRPTLLDRNGLPLALDRPSWDLVMDARAETRRLLRREPSAEARAALAALERAAGLDPGAAARWLLDPDCDRRVLASGLGEARAERVRRALRDLHGNGLRLVPVRSRVHPQGRVLAHVVGFTRLDEDGRRVGATGLERWLDDQATGAEPGWRSHLLVGREHGVDPLLDFRPPRRAGDVVVGLDARLAAEARHRLVALRREHQADWACAVMVDVRTGEVLVLEAVPDFDPNAPGRGMETRDGRPVGWRMPALWPIEPGSTVKPFVVAAALDHGAIRADEEFSNFDGALHLPGRLLHNERSVPRRPMTPADGLVFSSNVVLAQIGRRLGAERLRAAFLDLGFREGPGLDVFERDRGLFPPDSAWRRRNADVWTVASTSFGRELSLTPLRLAMAWTALVGDGRLRPPRWFPSEEAAAGGEPVFSPEVAATVRGWLEGVVTLEHRTWLPRWDDLRWGGKSGTVAKDHEDGYTTLFVAFGPLEDPRVVSLVVLENPRSPRPRGSRTCGPTAAALMRRALELGGVVEPPRRVATSLDSPLAPAIVAGSGRRDRRGDWNAR